MHCIYIDASCYPCRNNGNTVDSCGTGLVGHGKTDPTLVDVSGGIVYRLTADFFTSATVQEGKLDITRRTGDGSMSCVFFAPDLKLFMLFH